MKRAVISDIHSNLEALRAVLGDIERRGISEVYCLGDIIGYGPNPCECLDLVMKCQGCVLGNHDQAALFDPDRFNRGAERAILWTRDQLESPRGSPADNARRWDFLGELMSAIREDRFLFVHGSPCDPVNEYVFPEDVYQHQAKLARCFRQIDRYCFQGHTHVPGIFTEDLRYLAPEDVDHVYPLGEQKLMINVGSVGQPRDGDPRACYVLIEGERIQFVRIEYPVEVTIKKIYAIPELDNFLGDRLREGR